MEFNSSCNSANTNEVNVSAFPKTALDIYKYIDTLKRYEEKIEDSFIQVKEANEGKFFKCEEYGKHFDMLLMGTWEILQVLKVFWKRTMCQKNSLILPNWKNLLSRIRFRKCDRIGGVLSLGPCI